jgi:hypothetical protein
MGCSGARGRIRLTASSGRVSHAAGSVATYMEVQSMKRILALLVAALCLSIASASYAGIGGAAFTAHRLSVRKQGNALTGQSYNQVVQGYVDSVFAAHGSARTDTTAIFPLLNSYTGPGWYNSMAHADSIHIFTFRMVPAANQGGLGTTAGFDSAYVTPQFSMDGQNWISNNLVLILTEPTSLDGCFRVFNTVTVANSAPAAGSFYAWPYVRFIVQSDYTGAYQYFVDTMESFGSDYGGPR